MLANYHTHTWRCNHAKGMEREYVENAISAGLRVLGFSDHSPYIFDRPDYYSNFRMRPEETRGYIDTVLSLKREYASSIEILVGFEMEYYPSLFSKTLEFLNDFEYDYLILGQHFIGDEEIYSGAATDDEKTLARYVNQVTEGMKTGKFAYLAHPDLVRFTGPDKIFERHYSKLCEAAKELNMPLEINMLGLIDDRWYPNARFFKLAREIGNEIILGCDAHAPEHVANAGELKKADNFAKECAITISEPDMAVFTLRKSSKT